MVDYITLALVERYIGQVSAKIKEEMEDLSVLKFKGIKETIGDLPLVANIGDVWHVKEDGSEYAYIKKEDDYIWEKLGSIMDINVPELERFVEVLPQDYIEENVYYYIPSQNNIYSWLKYKYTNGIWNFVGESDFEELFEEIFQEKLADYMTTDQGIENANKILKTDNSGKIVPAAINTIADSTMSDSSDSPIQNKVVKQYIDRNLAEKQDTLESGINIKTINNQSVLGNGNIDITSTIDTSMSDTSINSVQNKVIKKYVDDGLADKQDELESGTNIKTINGTSLLGRGDIDTTITIDTEMSDSSENATQNKVVKGYVDSHTMNILHTDDPDGIIMLADLDMGIYMTDGVYSLKDEDEGTIFGTQKGFILQVREEPGTHDRKYTLTSEWGIEVAMFDGTEWKYGYVPNNIDVQEMISTKQDTLVNQQNIKSINNQSLLGSGNIVIAGGTVDTVMSDSSINAVENKVIKSYVDTETNKKQDTLISGTNVKTINGETILGSGDIDTTSTIDTEMSDSSENAVQNKIIKEYIDEGLADKQDTLESGVNVKTINGETILGNGNIDTTITIDSSISSTSTNPVQNKVIKEYTDASLNQKQDTLISGTNIKTINGEAVLGKGNIEVITTIDTEMSDSSENVVENKVIKEYVDDGLADKQDTLVSGTNIKTINNNSILGNGNIDITPVVDTSMSDSSENAVQNKTIKAYVDTELDKKADASALANYVSTAAVKQTTGSSTTDIMSQKATTDAINEKLDTTQLASGIETNIKTSGEVILDIEDEDYDAGIRFIQSLTNNNGTVLTLQGYANGETPTNYKPVIRNVASPSQNYDVANKKYVDENIVRPSAYLVFLKADGSIDTYSSTLKYNKVKSELTSYVTEVYLDVFYNDISRIHIPAIEDMDTNNGPIVFAGPIRMSSGDVAEAIFLLDSSDVLTVYYTARENALYKTTDLAASYNSEIAYPSVKGVWDTFCRKPVVIWESNDPASYLKGIQADLSADPAWQLTNLDLTPFKRIKIYSCAGQKSGATASASTTPAAILEMSLDSRTAIAAYGNNYIGSIMFQKPNDANRLATLTCAVSADKTKFVVLRQTNLYGTAATSNNDVNANVFLIEGYYD